MRSVANLKFFLLSEQIFIDNNFKKKSQGIYIENAI